VSTREKTHAPKGDERRAALLAALDHHLLEGDGALDSINIADISRRAGVTRSAFYFYFESKAAAVAALSEEMYDASVAAAAHLAADGTPADNIEAVIRTLFAAWEKHQYLYRAMLDARATSPAVREMWESDRLSFVAPLAEMIEAERSDGRAPAGADAHALASVLLELNDRMLERLSVGGDVERETLIDTVVCIWLRSIYGTPTSVVE
jgi:TetR/AcrR family transcriptional regulator, ethionamide resistance regulator